MDRLARHDNAPLLPECPPHQSRLKLTQLIHSPATHRLGCDVQHERADVGYRLSEYLP